MKFSMRRYETRVVVSVVVVDEWLTRVWFAGQDEFEEQDETRWNKLESNIEFFQ